MRLATIEQSKQLDERTQSEAKLPAEILMEAAGCLAANETLQTFLPETNKGRIAILCGPGNNGADGLAMARHLASRISSQRVTVFLLAPEEKRSDLFNIQLARLHSHGIEVHSLELVEPVDGLSNDVPNDVPNDVTNRLAHHVANGLVNPLKSELANSRTNDKKIRGWKFRLPQAKYDFRISDFSLWVEALFGIGFRGELERAAAKWVDAINSSLVQRLALDSPSGLNADTGVASGSAFRAHRTFTFGCLKTGFAVNDGPQFAGHIHVLNPGFPTPILRSVASTHLMVTRIMARKLKPARPASGNKTKFGHAAIFAGHDGMWGAGVLASTAAYRVGCGYVSLCSFDDPSTVVNQHPEILTHRIDSKKFWDDEKWRVAAIGPGLGTENATLDLLKKLIARANSGWLDSVVVDADAITVAAREKIFPLPENWIMTPHAGELTRILLADPVLAAKYKDSSQLSREIENDRFHFAKEAARVTGCWIMLKGFRTVVTHSKRERFWVIGSGNSALAKAGTGDVLTGFIVGLMSQKLSPLRAVCLGAFLHGTIADEWVGGSEDIRSLESSDLIRRVPDTLARL